MGEIEGLRDEITKKAMKMFGLEKKGENYRVTLMKAHNKFIFDKVWFDELRILEEDHIKQMAIILQFGHKRRLSKIKSNEIYE
jgi:hypothetical protein